MPSKNKSEKRGFILIVIMLITISLFSQEDVKTKKKLQTKSKSVESSITNGDNNLVIANKYEDLAKELTSQKDYTKAEEYQKKAIEIYINAHIKKQLAEALRVLAKIQESQNKTKEAISSYDNASKNSNENLNSILNNSDASRLRNNNNPAEQSKSINQKINSIKQQSNNANDANAEIIESYKQLAEVDVQQNNSESAIKNYNNALDVTNNNSDAMNIKNEIADIYAKENNIQQAITIKNNILQTADSIHDVNEQIKQRQGLAKLFILNNEEDKGLQLLQEAYNLSLAKGKTIEAKNSLTQLIAYYKTKHNDLKTLQLYDVFLQRLESLIKSDSTLIDKKIFDLTDSKIKQLEKEKKLKDELISKKNNFNYFLIIALVILLILIIVIINYSFAIRTKNKKISLQSLRREMNPHFVFNSLNSVNQFIAQNKEIEANKYLTAYSSLMRNMMENSSKDFIPLQKEIEQLQKYLELEFLRFNDKFDYKITVDESIDTDNVLMPNMIIQPHLENAIWHGLRYKESKGLLVLEIKNKSSYIELTIDDNGIGIEKSKQLKTQNQKIHQSIGITNINNRIALLNDIYKVTISCEIKNKTNNEGTLIIVKIPYLNKF